MKNRLTRILKGTEEKRFLKSLNLKGKVVYDIGAWTGKGTTLFFSELVGKSGLVYAFEPCYINFKKLLQNIKNKQNIIGYQQGLGCKTEKRLMIVPLRKCGRASMDKDIQKSLTNKEFIEGYVFVYTLDELIREDGLRPPDFVKIDTEGMELEILKGMINTIREWKPQLLIELHGVNQESKIINTDKILSFLQSMSYDLYHVETSGENVSDFYDICEGHIFAGEYIL